MWLTVLSADLCMPGVGVQSVGVNPVLSKTFQHNDIIIIFFFFNAVICKVNITKYKVAYFYRV